jgi:hypothetical protein
MGIGDVIRPLYQDPVMYLGEADGPAARVPENEDEVGGDVIRAEDGDLVIVGVRHRVLTHRHVQQRTRTNHLRQKGNKKPENTLSKITINCFKSVLYILYMKSH